MDLTQEQIEKEIQIGIKLRKLEHLINWFDTYFDKQLSQSIWQDDFEVSHDDYFDKDYTDIDELKAQAKLVRDEIRELRKERE